ncbi:hypothetical protein [Flavobacterium psychrotrophum]|uniref:hypothetical protein n=1 Tax=Flavobacterium psychrotrophum TaxID=2294119 RepID=UPI000E312282|nr:hypothetical protein [Flavobacterium psychrotrophum]
MKTIILLCTLLYITTCTAQSHKDSLLLADAVPVRDTLDMIFYLDSRASNYLIMTKEEQRASNVNFSRFYEDEIKGANTVYTIDIDNF